MKPGQTIGRFRVISIDTLDEYQGCGILFKEEHSGAEIYHLHNDDAENLFSFNFATLPENSNGVAHILEHTVLCGSERYPVRDPFFMLYKGSMQTFLNAMTFPDKTLYPAASTVKQDLFNLMSVYADAVFFPLLRREHFLQEGHRLGLNPRGEGEIAGIVYNEMKAQYSTQDAIEEEWCTRSLLPDTPYGHDSGGDPGEIPSLSYEDFCAFHKTYYHPSNCRIFLYGNIASEDYLHLLDEMVFSRFSSEELKKRSFVEVPLQSAWTSPRTLELSYPVSAEEADSSSVNLNWLLPEPKNGADIIAMEVLSDVLFNSPASPVQKLILESKLGGDMSSSTGLVSNLRQPVFTVGMRGAGRDSAEKIETLILSGLERVVKEGIDAELIQASLRRFEFYSREIKGGVPFGLRLLMRGLKRWLHGDDPTESIQFTPILEALKDSVQGRPQFFSEMVRQHMLNNPHRSRVTLYPDQEQNARDEGIERQLIAKKLKALGDGAQEILKADTEAFQQFQQQTDRPKDIATIPFLSVDDIPRDITTIPHRRSQVGGRPLHVHELFTNGISYIDLAFDISRISREQQLFIPFLFHLLPQIGTMHKSYSQVSMEWGLKTGGFSLYPTHFPNISGEHRQYAYIRLKTLHNMSADGIALLREVLQEADFSDRRYLWEIYNEYRNDFRSGIVPNGMSYAGIRARRGITPHAYTDDLWNGLIQFRFTEGLHANGEKAAEILSDTLSVLMNLIFDPELLSFHLVCDEAQSITIERQLEEFLTALKQKPSSGKQHIPDIHSHLPTLADILLSQQPAVEGLEYSTKVNFTALALKGSLITREEQVHEHILSHILQTGLLHEKIRMEGGAYGAFCSTNPLTGVFSFGSYRDPAISRSWTACEESLKTLASHPPDQQSLDLAKISLAGRELRPLSPSEKGSIGFRRLCCDVDDDLRSRRRAWLIRATTEDIQQAAEGLCAALPDARRAVLADPETLKTLEIPELVRVSMQYKDR